MASHQVPHPHDFAVYNSRGHGFQNNPFRYKFTQHILVFNFLSNVQSPLVKDLTFFRAPGNHSANTHRGDMDEPCVVAAAKFHQVGHTFHIDLFQFIPCSVVLHYGGAVVNGAYAQSFEGFQRAGVGNIPVHRNDAFSKKLIKGIRKVIHQL